MMLSDSLISQLPKIAAAGRREADKVLARVELSRAVSLQLDEHVFPVWAGGSTAAGTATGSQEWSNRLIYGDNLLLMEALLAGDPSTGLPPLKGKTDLIYIDPPFASRASYRTSCSLPGRYGPFVLEQQAYSDTWEEGMTGYLRMLCPRLFLMRELLSERGSLIIHLDWHAVHYVKVLLDDIFGPESFRNEIAWCYGGGGAPRRSYPKKHDMLLWYTKGDTWTFNKQFRPYTQSTLERGLTAVKGDKYELRQQGAGLDDWWAGDDVQKILSPTAYENLKFDTQKPEGLLKKIITGHSNEGDLVADFFCGSGTTGAVAEKLGRKWVLADTSKLACMTAYRRLLSQGSRPFICQSVSNYPGTLFHRSCTWKRTGDLARDVLALFGAETYRYDLPRGLKLGYLDKSRSLVLAASPNRRVNSCFLKKAQELRDSLPGGWERIIVLVWQFTFDIIEQLGELDDQNLKVLIISPELLEHSQPAVWKMMHKKGRCFSLLRHLLLERPEVRSCSPEMDEVTLQLAGYRFLFPEFLPPDTKASDQVQDLIAADPLALISYWSVDPDYDGRIFRSRWQCCRGDNLRVSTAARLLVPRGRESRKICVKAVDVFGYESMAVYTVQS